MNLDINSVNMYPPGRRAGRNSRVGKSAVDSKNYIGRNCSQNYLVFKNPISRLTATGRQNLATLVGEEQFPSIEKFKNSALTTKLSPRNLE